MTPRISLVAVCWVSDSARELCTSAYDGAGWVLAEECLRGVPHSSQNLASGRFSCWHRGHCIPPSGGLACKRQNSESRLDWRPRGGQLPKVSSATPPGADPARH